MLSTKVSTPSAMGVSWLTIMLTPTMPPSKMVAGTKNSSSAKAANAAPAVRKTKLAKNCRKVENFVLFMITFLSYRNLLREGQGITP